MKERSSRLGAPLRSRCGLSFSLHLLEEVTGLRKGYADTRFGQVHYVSEGAGEPVLLFHSTPLSWTEFSDALPILAKEFLVVAVDTIGYGSSDKPPRELTLIEYGQTVVDLLDHLRIDQASLVGFHTGCAVAAEAAAANPSRVKKLLLCGYPLWSEQDMVGRRQRIIPEYLRQPDLKEDGSHMLRLWHGKSREPEKALEAAIVMLQSRPRYFEAWFALYAYEPEKRLPLIKCPTVILETDKDVFLAQAERAKAMIRGSEVVVIEGPSMLPHGDPRLFAETVARLLKGMK